jgi:hypothetical protein
MITIRISEFLQALEQNTQCRLGVLAAGTKPPVLPTIGILCKGFAACDIHISNGPLAQLAHTIALSTPCGQMQGIGCTRCDEAC